jgi:hypothetical protein
MVIQQVEKIAIVENIRIFSGHALPKRIPKISEIKSGITGRFHVSEQEKLVNDLIRGSFNLCFIEYVRCQHPVSGISFLSLHIPGQDDRFG